MQDRMNAIQQECKIASIQDSKNEDIKHARKQENKNTRQYTKDNRTQDSSNARQQKSKKVRLPDSKNFIKEITSKKEEQSVVSIILATETTEYDLDCYLYTQLPH